MAAISPWLYCGCGGSKVSAQIFGIGWNCSVLGRRHEYSIRTTRIGLKNTHAPALPDERTDGITATDGELCWQ